MDRYGGEEREKKGDEGGAGRRTWAEGGTAISVSLIRGPGGAVARVTGERVVAGPGGIDSDTRGACGRHPPLSAAPPWRVLLRGGGWDGMTMTSPPRHHQRPTCATAARHTALLSRPKEMVRLLRKCFLL